MAKHTEDMDQLGAYYKGKFDELSDVPEDSVKDSLFERMDLMEGKRPKTVYLHFNMFGMKVAASITMVIVSSLALMAVAAVTILAVRNNAKKTSTELPSLEQLKHIPSPTIGPQKPVLSPSTSPKKEESNLLEPSVDAEGSAATLQENAPIEMSPSATERPTIAPAIPIEKSGDNSKLLQEVDDEEDLFKK